jgi:hypothetical protein
MDNNLFTYIEHLELITFFAGYPLVYAAVHVIAGNQLNKQGFVKKLAGLLPFAYALTATLFLGLVIKNISVNRTTNIMAVSPIISNLEIWGCLAIVCWIPFVAKKPIISLLHSLFFFFILLKDILFQNASSAEVIKNDMKIYTDSLILNTGTFLLVIMVSSFIYKVSSKTGSSLNKPS